MHRGDPVELLLASDLAVKTGRKPADQRYCFFFLSLFLLLELEKERKERKKGVGKRKSCEE